MVGSAIIRQLLASGHSKENLITRTHAELDLTNQAAVKSFFEAEKPDQVYLAADNEQWEALMATDEAQTLLNKMANEALSEHQAGKTKTMGFNHGRIVPG